MDFLAKVDALTKEGLYNDKIQQILHNFWRGYTEALDENQIAIEQYSPVLEKFLDYVADQLENPYTFEPYHPRDPEYTNFSIEFIRSLVKTEESTVIHPEIMDEIAVHLQKKNNVIFFANHQVEPDPHVIFLLLEKTHPELSKEMIFVAGHRVTTDPLAVPFSRGCNLFCIYSKKHIENPPDLKEEKMRHNQKTMQKMKELLAEGGKCIYVAPSGGRDRMGANGVIEIAPFDPQSITMFWLMAQQSGHPTHFYPLALATYDLLPPPNSVETDLGEQRHPKCTPIHLAFGEEIDMVGFPGSDTENRLEKRQKRAEYIEGMVKRLYSKLT